MRTKILAAAIAAGVTLSAPAGAVVINFDDLPAFVAVTNQYAEATFSAASGAVSAYTGATYYGTTAPHFICSIGCSTDISVVFTNPVNNLTFLSLGDDDIGTGALVDVFDAGGLLGTVNVVTDGAVTVPDLVDLSSFVNVTSITIRAITDSAGLGFDDFTFDLSNSVATPEPASMALFGLGLLGLAASRRR